MLLQLRPATLDDVAFLADVVIIATQAQGRFPSDIDVDEYRAGYEDWTRETVLGVTGMVLIGLGIRLSLLHRD